LSHIEAILRPYCADIEDATCRYDAIANQGWYHKNGLGGFNMVQHDSNWSHKSGTGAVCGTGAVWVVLTPVPCGHQHRSLRGAEAWALSFSIHFCVMFVVVSSDRAKVVDGALEDIEAIKVDSTCCH
jgi:hypothetical protein